MTKDTKKTVSQFDFQVFCINQEAMNKNVTKLLEGHEKRLEVANSEMGTMVKLVTNIGNDVEWLKKSYWAVATASIGAIVASIANLIK